MLGGWAMQGEHKIALFLTEHGGGGGIQSVKSSDREN